MYKSIARTFSACVILGLITILFGYANYRDDPFSRYRDFVKKPLVIKPKRLDHFYEEEQLIRDKLKLDLSRKERSILSGLHWIIGLVDDEKNFKFLFPDFMLLMDALSTSHGRLHQKEVAHLISQKALLRAKNQLKKLFLADEEGLWKFIRLLPILVKYPELEGTYLAFYKKHWPNAPSNQSPEVEEFVEAMKQPNYHELFDILVFTSFPHYYRLKAKNPVLLPPDKFPEYLKEFEKFTYQDHPIQDDNFRDLGYLVTHIPLVLTNYGEYPLPKGINTEKAKVYIESSLEKARQLGDFDLYAEYVQCLKMFGPNDTEQIRELEKFLYNLQRPDGSWGSERDFTTNAYTAIHPGGAAMMALNQVYQQE